MPEQERKVKGTLVIALAMIVNDRKDFDWKGNTGLTDQDLALVRDRIMSSTWYNLDFYARLGSAVFKVAGGSRTEGAHEFGQGIMWRILLKTYRNTLLRNDPERALSGFSMLYKGTFFDSGSAEFKAAGNGGLFTISDPLGIPTPESFVPMIQNLLKKIAAENGAQDVKVECERAGAHASAKLKAANYKISWTKK